jgi:hypothetical protein
MLVAYEAARFDPDIQVLIADRESQRQRTAGWSVDGVTARASLRHGLDRVGAIDMVWMLMNPVVFSRLTRIEVGASTAMHHGSLTASFGC